MTREGSPNGVPRFTVASVQNENEMLHDPARDVTAFLNDSSQWRVESFTERTFGGLLKSVSHYSCVVLGSNAVYRSDRIRQALMDEPTPANLVVLAQDDPGCFEFLKDELALELLELPSDHEVEAVVAVERKASEEVLLNWPRRVLDPAAERSAREPGADVALDGDASWYFRSARESPWRVVLEVRAQGKRFPVVLRTSSTSPKRVIVCSFALEWRNERHAELLENLITYCAVGPPEVVVVEKEVASTHATNGRGSIAWNAGVIARRLRLQGATAVQYPVKSAETVNFAEWPLKGAHHVVLADVHLSEDLLSTDDSARWLESGGTLVELSDSKRLMVQSGASEAHWVAQRWAAWLNQEDPARWQKNIFNCRAVLRVLEELHRPGSGARPERLAMKTPRDYKAEVERLLEEKDRDRRLFHTISWTAAAYDLIHLADLHDHPLEGEIRNWLRRSFERASVEDRFNIARALSEPGLLKEALASARQGEGTYELSAICHIRMREAAVACGTGFGEIPATEPMLGMPGRGPDAPGVERPSRSLLTEFDDRMLLSAEFTTALVRFASLQSDKDEVLSESADRAIATIARRGQLTRLGWYDPSEIDPEVIGTEALALLAYSSLTRESTLLIRPETSGVPISAIEPVIAEAERARQEEQKAQASLEFLKEKTQAELKLLTMAQHLLGASALVAAVAAVAGAWALERSKPIGIAEGAALAVLILSPLLTLGFFALISRFSLRATSENDSERALAMAKALLGLLSVAASCGALVVGYAIASPSESSERTFWGLSTGALVLTGAAGLLIVLIALLKRADLSPAWGERVSEALQQSDRVLPRLLSAVLRRPDRTGAPSPPQPGSGKNA